MAAWHAGSRSFHRGMPGAVVFQHWASGPPFSRARYAGRCSLLRRGYWVTMLRLSRWRGRAGLCQRRSHQPAASCSVAGQELWFQVPVPSQPCSSGPLGLFLTGRVSLTPESPQVTGDSGMPLFFPGTGQEAFSISGGVARQSWKLRKSVHAL